MAKKVYKYFLDNDGHVIVGLIDDKVGEIFCSVCGKPASSEIGRGTVRPAIVGNEVKRGVHMTKDK